MRTLSPMRSLFASIAALCLALPAAHAASIVQVQKTTTHTEARVGYDTITFRLSYNCASLTSNASSAIITDQLDNNFELLGTTTSNHVQNVAVSGNLITFNFKPNLPAGASGDVSIQARFKSTTAINYTASNKATARANNSDPFTSNTVTIKATPPPSGGGTTLVYDSQLKVDKSVPGEVLQNGGLADYNIAHGITFPTGQTVRNYTITDSFPAGMALETWWSDYFPGTDKAVSVRFKTNLNGNWRAWGSTPRANTGSGRTGVSPSELGLPATEYVTGLQFLYGDLPGGPQFHRQSQQHGIYIRCRYVGASNTVGALLENCADATATNITSDRSCGTNRTQVAAPRPMFHVYPDGTTPGGSYTWGDEFEQRVTVAVDSLSSVAMDNPTAAILLPSGLEYVGYLGLNSPHTVPAPTVTTIPNFENTGGTLVSMRWAPELGNAFSLPKSTGIWSMIQLRLKLRIGNSMANGWYESKVFAKGNPEGAYFGWNERDAYDFDRDNNRDEILGYHRQYIQIMVNSGAASMVARMEVKGDLDNVPKVNPDTAMTTPAGAADYTLRIKNESGVVFRDLTIIDILPFVGDKGVVDTSSRGSTFEPFLAGPITAPGATVSYSTSRNPCRPELVSSGPVGCEPPNWSTTPPADITTVQSVKLEFGAMLLEPNNELVVGWPMRVPLGAPSGPTDIAWNSFGMVATRNDDGTRLLPSEPQRTGVRVQPPVPPFIGDTVWLDANGNGLQDTTETGINGLRLDLYADNGDNTADPSVDTLVKFTATYRNGTKDGSYLFANMGPGKYFVVLHIPNTLGVTSPDAGDDTLDSDGQASQLAGTRIAISPVTELIVGEEDLTVDFGLLDRSKEPAVWATQTLADGKVLIGGRFATSHGLSRKNIARLLPTGQPDAGFNPGSGFDGDVLTLAVLTNGNVLAGGKFKNFNGQSRNGLSLLNPNGTAAPAPPQPDTPDVRWVEANGSYLYVAGAFTKLGGVPAQGIARLTATGQLDGSFNTGNGANAAVHCGVVQPDGGAYIGGSFTSYAGVNRNRIAKLLPDGKLDPSFSPGQGANGEILSLKQLADGRLVLTGKFNEFNGTKCRNAVRIYPDGRIDPTMTESDLSINSINSTN